MRIPTRYALPLVAGALLVSGCSSAVPGSGVPATSEVSSSAPAPSSPPLAAANGSDISACGDADCEILIHGQVEIPLNPTFRCTRYAVVYFAPNRVAFNIDCADTGQVTGYVLGRGTIHLATAISLEVDRIDETGAVLHFQPKMSTTDPTRNQVSGEFGAAFT